ncbi:MAG: tetratricopeptide repeat protein [Bryobacteraceae bacterium]
MLKQLILLAALSVSALAAANYQQAEAAVMRGAWDDALGMVRQLLETNPRDLKALNLMGLALTGKGSTAEANRTFEKALEIDPNFYPARKNLAINELRLKQLAESERDFATVLAAMPNDPVVNMYMGELAFARKDYAGAIEHLKLAGPWLEKDGRLDVMAAECEFQLGNIEAGTRELKRLTVDKLEPAWQFRAGYLLAEHEQFADAIKFFEAVRVRSPGAYDIGFNLALCDVHTKRFADAIALLSDFRAHGHKTSEVDNLLAEAYEGSGKTQQAIDALREATALEPEDERNYIDLAMLCADHNAFDLGLEVVNIGLGHLPRSNGLVVERGVIYAMSGKFDLAEKDFERAGQSEGDKDAASAGLGLAYIEQGEVTRATAALRDRIRQDPNNAALEYLLAESLIRSGVHAGDPEFVEAQAALQQSVRLNPRFVYSRVDLAKIYLQQGKTDEAIQQLRAALEIDGSKVQVYAQLGTALRREGKTEEAAAMFAKVRELNEYNRKHGEPARLVKAGAGQDSDALDARK